MGKKLSRGDRCRIIVTQPLGNVFEKYQPEIGKVYDAVYCTAPKGYRSGDFCVISVKDKKIVVRRDEFEIVEDEGGRNE